MGRTSKYQKIKACDPFSKKNGGKHLDLVGLWGLGDNGAKPKKRSRTAEKLRQQKINRRLKRMKNSNNWTKVRSILGEDGGLNRPPSDNRDEFDLDDIEGSLKRKNDDTSIHVDTKARTSVKSVASSGDSKSRAQGTIDKEEVKDATKLFGNDVKAVKFECRRENENKKAYNRRAKEETRHIIKEAKMKELNPQKRKRRKEFLNLKKKRQRSFLSKDELGVVDEGSRRVDRIPFVGQVERPPIFKILPRGASSRSRKGGYKKSMEADKEVLLEHENLDKIRQNVQEQYSMIKAKRKLAGDFHL